MREEFDACSKFDVGTHMTKRTDDATGPELRSRLDHSRRMNTGLGGGRLAA
jgi:hypothetical protein